MKDKINLSYSTTENGIVSDSYYWGISLGCCICENKFMKHRHWSLLYPHITEPGYVVCDDCDGKLQEESVQTLPEEYTPNVVCWFRRYFDVDGTREYLTIGISQEC